MSALRTRPPTHVQSTSEGDPGRDVEQRACGIAEDRPPLGVAQAWGVKNVLHGCARPRIREIGVHHDLASAAFRHQTALEAPLHQPYYNQQKRCQPWGRPHRGRTPSEGA